MTLLCKVNYFCYSIRMTKQPDKVCPVTTLLTLLSKRHMLVIVYTLWKQPLGFNGLQETTSINSATLSKRLRELETVDLVQMQVCPKDTRQHYYSLTKRGQKLSKVLQLFAKV